MPIRINLLAEAQATEDLRRRDPVKRAIWVAILLVLGMLVFASSLWLKAIVGKSELAREESVFNTHSNEYRVVLENERKLNATQIKLAALNQLASNRFLNGTLLDALQHSVIDDVQLLRLRTDQAYALTLGTKPKTNDNGTITRAKPSTITEKIVLTLEARDTSSPHPGDLATVYRDTLAEASYFKNSLGRTNQVKLQTLSPEQTGLDGRLNVQFTLECRFPEKTR